MPLPGMFNLDANLQAITTWGWSPSPSHCCSVAWGWEWWHCPLPAQS